MSKEPTHPYHSLLVIDDHNMIVNGIRLLIGDRFAAFYQANDGATGNPVTSFSRWLAPFIGALLWPVLVSVMGKVHER